MINDYHDRVDYRANDRRERGVVARTMFIILGLKINSFQLQSTKTFFGSPLHQFSVLEDNTNSYMQL
jgi:hypothetical protein